MRAGLDMKQFSGAGYLERYFAEIKKMSGITPVDELFASFTHYLTIFKQHSQESVREYVEREAKSWEEVQEATASMDGSEEIDGQQPLHDHLRGMLLLRRSVIQDRDYPLIFKECTSGTPFEGIKRAMLESYKEFRSLKGNQGTFAPRQQKPQRQTGYDAEELEEPCGAANQDLADSWSEQDWQTAFGAQGSADPANVGEAT